MKSALLRTGSVPLLSPNTTPSSSFSNNKQPLYGLFSSHNSSASSPRSISLHYCRRNHSNRIRRAASESDIVRSLHEVSNTSDQFSGLASRSRSRSRSSFPSKIPEEEFLNEDHDHQIFDSDSMEEDKIFLNSRIGINDRSKIGAYYEHMLKLNPSDALLLRNYGKFLHEVENDTKRAEECYSRAILGSPTDGELLALYGKLVWDTQRDKQRAQYYFDRAVYASPNDCLVTGHYAHFMWEVEDDEAAAEDSAAGMVRAY